MRSAADDVPGAPDPWAQRERRQLLALAYRMLGTAADAEDAVQEAYLRLARLDAARRAELREPGAWLTRVTARICLDAAGSARARREAYVGPWLPEPLPETTFRAGGDDPLEQVSLDESISTALVLVLGALTPAERVAFVLHDVFGQPFAEIAETVGRTPGACRQLASSARARLRAAQAGRVSRREHDAVVRAFAAASRSGDLRSLIAVLDPDVVLHSDGGGRVSAARRPVVGADRVARFLLGVLTKDASTEVLERRTLDGLGFLVLRRGRAAGVVTLDVVDGRVAALRLVLNPEKLTRWRTDADRRSGGGPRPVADDRAEVDPGRP